VEKKWRPRIRSLIHLQQQNDCKDRTNDSRASQTQSIRSAASQWNDLIKSRKVNMRAKGMSNSSRKIVKANNDSVTKNHRRSYSRYQRDISEA